MRRKEGSIPMTCLTLLAATVYNAGRRSWSRVMRWTTSASQLCTKAWRYTSGRRAGWEMNGFSRWAFKWLISISRCLCPTSSPALKIAGCATNNVFYLYCYVRMKRNTLPGAHPKTVCKGHRHSRQALSTHWLCDLGHSARDMVSWKFY